MFNHILNQFAKDNKRFVLSQVDKNARFREYRGVLEWLNDVNMDNICYKLNTLDLPFKGNYMNKEYKIYIKDTGLLVDQLDDESQADLRVNKNLSIYKGTLYENVVAEAFIKSGLELFYFKNNDNRIERNFVSRSKNNIAPIEVKASKGVWRSINRLIEDDKYPLITHGIKLSKNNIGFKGKANARPYFLSFGIKDYLKVFNSQDGNFIYKYNLISKSYKFKSEKYNEKTINLLEKKD